ncbi:MAG: isochorismatase family cysteine hydrolase [Verrucomicrobiota bacterium]
MKTIKPLRQTKLQRIKELHSLEPGRTALLVIDMQHGFLDPGASLEVPKGRDILPNVIRLVAACRRSQVPVIFTEFVYAPTLPCLRGDPFGAEHLPAVPGQPTGFGYPSSNCLIGPQAGQGAESAATVDALAPRPDELVVRAHTYDKFCGTPLDLALRSRGVDRLIVTGVTTDVCVNATILAASTRNYRVIAVSDGMATIRDHLHTACLEIWQNKFARIATTAEVAEELGATGGSVRV